MVDLGGNYIYEKAESSDQEYRALEGKPDSGREEKALSGKHPATSKRVHGIRRRTRKFEDAERISENTEEYPSSTRYLESSLGIKSYPELASHLAKAV
jgi:hypothetical protein